MDKLKDEFLMPSVQQIQNILTFTILYLRGIRLFTFPSWGVGFLSCTFNSFSVFKWAVGLYTRITVYCYAQWNGFYLYRWSALTAVWAILYNLSTDSTYKPWSVLPRKRNLNLLISTGFMPAAQGEDAQFSAWSFHRLVRWILKSWPSGAIDLWSKSHFCSNLAHKKAPFAPPSLHICW